MTSAQICALNGSLLDKVKVLKQDFDATFERLTVRSSQQDLQKIESLQLQIETELGSPLIARSVEQMSDRTLVYIGKFEPGIFQKMPKTVERIYASFPDAEVYREQLVIGGKTNAELQALMEEKELWVSMEARSMLDSPDFVTSKQPDQIDVIRLQVKDLGLPDLCTTDEMYKRIHELGLELCPPEVGPHYRLAHLGQPIDDWVFVGMKPIIDEENIPSVFAVMNSEYRGLSFIAQDANPYDQWRSEDQLVFRVRKEV